MVFLAITDRLRRRIKSRDLAKFLRWSPNGLYATNPVNLQTKRHWMLVKRIVILRFLLLAACSASNPPQAASHQAPRSMQAHVSNARKLLRNRRAQIASFLSSLEVLGIITNGCSFNNLITTLLQSIILNWHVLEKA